MNYLTRCIELGLLAGGKNRTNPMVGAVLVHKDRIIGEGWHDTYGEAHAEVEAVHSVPQRFKHLIAESTLYISLEPCNFVGKTPACTQLILDFNIKHVIIAILDQTPRVAGNSVALLQAHGVRVEIVRHPLGSKLAASRNVLVRQKRPYTVLKYAVSKDNYISRKGEQTAITSLATKRLVHQWRSLSNAILIGANTALVDDPQLTNRYYFGAHPLRVIIDPDGITPQDSYLLNDPYSTIVVTREAMFEEVKPLKNSALKRCWNYDFNESGWMDTLLKDLTNENIGTLMVEGGAMTTQQFIDRNIWDEAYLLRGEVWLHQGIEAPKLKSATLTQTVQIGSDQLMVFENASHQNSCDDSQR